MKILALDLRAFGPFSGVQIDLSGGDHGLHMILGANEAGKTSAMRALNALLFGFHSQSADIFIHGYDRLRVGATLRHSDGETFEFVRRKGNKNTLRGSDDLAIVADERLERLLGGIDQRTFESLFGLDHEKLAEAGKAIGEGKGLLGETLFAAGTGLAGLKKAQQGLRKQLDDLFKPRAMNPTINRALTELREAKESLKKAQLPGEDWIKQDAELRSCRDRAAMLSESLDRLRIERDLLIRTRSAIPQVPRWRKLQAEIAGLGHVVRLRESFGDDCRSTLDDLRSADEAIERLRTSGDELNRELEATAAPGPILGAELEVEAVNKQLGAIEKAIIDRGKITTWAAEQEYKAKEILRKLGRPAELEEAEALRSLRDDELAAIRTLGQRESGLRAERDAVALAIAEQTRKTSRLAEDRANLGEAVDGKLLRSAVLRARKLGDLDDRLSKGLAAQKKKLKDVEKALGRLSNWSGDLEALERIEIPLDPTLDRIELANREAAKKEEKLAEKIAEGEDAIDKLTSQLASIDRSLNVPTERDLDEARSRRDEGWKLVREGATGSEVTRFVDEFGPEFTLFDAFERAFRLADELSDRLRREADHVARKAELISQVEGQKASVERWKVDLRGVRARVVEQDQEWRSLVEPIGVSVSSPAELRAWLLRRAEVLRVAELAQDADRERGEAERILNEQFATFGPAFEASGTIAPPLEKGFQVWLELAEEILTETDRESRRRDDLETRLADARVEADLNRIRLEKADEHLSTWKADWALKLDRLGYESDMTPAQANTILAEIQDLRETMIKYRDFTGRIRSIDRDVEQFSAEVIALAQRLAPELEGLGAAALVQELVVRLKAAKLIDQKRSDLTGRRDAEVVRLREAVAKRSTAEASLNRLRQEAGCESAEGLAAAGERSKELTRLRGELRLCEDGLHASAAGEELETFAGLVERTRSDDLAPRIGQIESEIASRNAELGGIKESMGLALGELRRMDGGDHSAGAAEESQAVLARLQGDVTRYATLRLADSILKRGIDRYREKNQGPILARAGELFSDLTGGSFARLQIDDEDGLSVLQGVRLDGTVVGVEGLSDGTHDQLYLALRLASLEAWLRTHEPIPLIVDDILLNFDDRRSLAALRALARLSRSTQVLFFTHHRHLVDLAESNLPGDILFRHELADPCAKDRPKFQVETILTYTP